MTERLAGGRPCGAARYEATAEETTRYIRHCVDCQRWSGSAHHAAIVVAAGDLKVDAEPKVFA